MKLDIEKMARGLRIASEIVENQGVINQEVVMNAFFSARFSDVEAYFDSWHSYAMMNQKDFPDMANREEVRFLSGKHELAGYLYKVPLAKGLVLYVHGMRGFADGGFEAVGIREWMNRGFHVFAIDLSNSGRSDCYTLMGLQQSALDVAAAESYIASRCDLANVPLFLFGHSWGAYGCAASLALNDSPKAVAAIAGFDEPIEEMLQIPARYAGKVVEQTRESLTDAMSFRDSQYWDLSSAKAVKSAQKARVFVAQGGNDVTVSPTCCLYSKLKENTPSHVRLHFEPQAEHTGILFDPACWEYRKSIEKLIKEYSAKYGRKVSEAPANALQEFCSSFSKPMTGIVNKELYDEVEAFFLASL